MTIADEKPIGSLNGLRVLEVGTSVAAPFASQILGDLGAEVVKIERVDTGDDTRAWSPPSWDGESVAFLYLNRNKKSIVLDYKATEGREVLERLVASADILIQNLRPGAFEKAGFGAERLKELNPRLIYCELSGFGSVGPRAEQPAYDPLLQAYSGIVSMTGPDGSEPCRVPVSVLDMGSAMWLVIAIFDALRRRDDTGRGAHVQSSLLQTALMWVSPALMGCAAGLEPPRRLGSGFGGVVPYGAFPTKDGHIFVSAGNQSIWLRLLKAIEAQDLQDIPGFMTNEERVANREKVVAEVGRRTSAFTIAELEERLAAAGVPHSPVKTVDQVLTDPQVAALGQIQPLPHPRVPELQVVNLPITIDGEQATLRTPPPALGGDTREVLETLGMSVDDITRLTSTGVVQISVDDDLSESARPHGSEKEADDDNH